MPSCFIGLCLSTFKRQSHKMVKHSQAVRRQFATNCLSAFDHFVKLALKRVIKLDVLADPSYTNQLAVLKRFNV